MSWRRLGLVYVPDGTLSWARSHAALATPLHLRGDNYRVFFSTRDLDKRSHVGWVDIEICETPRILAAAREPVLAPGSDGTFDDSGIGIGSIVVSEGKLSMYYMGWNLGIRSPWRNAIGLARCSIAGGTFTRFSSGPILDRSPEDPYTLSYPWVLRLGPEDWRMWYGSNLAPAVGNADMQHAIKLARSTDGIRWTRDGRTVIGFADPAEYAIARPSVVKVGSALLMCFACRGSRYRVGAATSHDDGTNWMRIDSTVGLDASDGGWDSEMTCYPALFWHSERLWMTYGGNGYGASGFGLAVWDGPLEI